MKYIDAKLTLGNNFLNFQVRKKDQINLESKIKAVRFIGEPANNDNKVMFQSKTDMEVTNEILHKQKHK